MKTGVIVFPGSNCDRDTVVAIEGLLGATSGEVQKVWHADSELPKLDLVILPGGFSHGDYLRSGAMAARAPIMQAIRTHAAQGRRVLGICNGFQVLAETEMLPGTLMRNAGLHFICRTVHLRVEQADSAFTRGYNAGQVIRVPVAHHDGNYFADAPTLASLEDNGQVLFRYCDASGELPEEANPNGSCHHIAGIVNKAGNVAGMMPHPERACETLTGGTDGRTLFQGLLHAA